MKKLFVLGVALFFCLVFTGCSWVTAPLFIPDNGGMDKYGVINVKSLFGSVSTSLDSIKACVDCYVAFLGDPYTLASYEVNPWNYCGYRTIDRLILTISHNKINLIGVAYPRIPVASHTGLNTGCKRCTEAR